MTRINVVPVTELCDQHLLAEHRELTRIPNIIQSGKYRLQDQPEVYKLGTGHVKFFYDKLKYLHKRYIQLTLEARLRGFNVSYIWPTESPIPMELYKDYKPTAEAMALNRERIADRMQNFKARFTPHKESALNIGNEDRQKGVDESLEAA